MMKKPLVMGELKATVPVIQGGMGVGISLSRLAGTVAACGGVGVISTAQIGWQEEDFFRDPFAANFRAIRKEIKKAREIAKGGVLGANIMVATQRYEEYVKTAVDAGIDLIISGAGLPADLPHLVEGSKTKIAPIVSSLKAFRVISRLWERRYQRIPDLVIIEGPRAGGHLGFSKKELEQIDELQYDSVIVSIIAEVRELGKRWKRYIPVAVAGGIYDHKDVEHALSLGADCVQVGTRFVTTYECDASPAYKQAYLDAEKEDICLVDSPVGMPGRAIFNSFLQKVKKERKPVQKCCRCIKTCNPKETPYCITQALVQAAEGNTEEGLLFCGSNAWRAHKLEHVQDVMEELAGFSEDILEN